MKIDLFAEPPTVKDIEAARAELDNSRLLVIHNDDYVARLYHKLLIKTIVIIVILALVGVLYFILPVGMFGMANGRTILLVTVSVMLLTSLFWIGWRTWNEARSIVPSRGHSHARIRDIQARVDELADVDVKLRLNVLNWSRSNGVLSEYVKKITRQHRHPITAEYRAIRSLMEKLSAKKTSP